MTFDSAEAIAYTAYFLIPGFIIAEVINSIIPGKRRGDAEKVLAYLGFSILNFGCWFWLFDLINTAFTKHTSYYWFVLIISILATGFVTGCAVGFLKKHNPIRYVMKKFKIQSEHPIPTAWEYKFSNLAEGRYLTVSLDNGDVLRGAYFNKSMVSSDMDNVDIYLEESYLLDENGVWKKVKGTDGVWVSSKSIVWISFMKKEVIDND